MSRGTISKGPNTLEDVVGDTGVEPHCDVLLAETTRHTHLYRRHFYQHHFCYDISSYIRIFFPIPFSLRVMKTDNNRNPDQVSLLTRFVTSTPQYIY